ncbi:MAG: NAD(P)-binding domain-containing protein, partial [Acidobacteriota bacterium]|nr:NAD(P)-binding domain-containing protein [Acidobacteriota bacterium]
MTQPSNDSIHAVGVIGAGTMGRGIAHTLLRAGYSVVLADAHEKSLTVARESISRGLARDAEKGRLTDESAGQALARLT